VKCSLEFTKKKYLIRQSKKERKAKAKAKAKTKIQKQSGKFPVSYPKTTGINSQYWRKVTEAASFQWEFGHGLSYSTFEYSDLQLDPIMVVGQELKITTKVRNLGPLPGKEAVLLFLTDEYRQVVPEVKLVRSFFVPLVITSDFIIVLPKK